MDAKDTLLDASDFNNSIDSHDMPAELVDSYGVAKRLLPFMAKRGIPATPQNYRLFYDYLIYSNSDLNVAINVFLSSESKFNQLWATEIYNKFYTNEINKAQTNVITHAASEFMAMSSAMEQNLELAKTKTHHYQKILSDSSRQISSQNDFGSLQPMLNELLAETETALVSHTQFSEQIQAANYIIADLKVELKNQITLATIDELTKLHNRRYFNQEAPRMAELAQKMGVPLTAIVFDLDKFKLVNDTWGHNFGDKILILCASLLKKIARKTDMLIRLGGEEFLLLCSGLNITNACRVAERIRECLATTDITIRGHSLKVTLSGGVAEYIHGEDLNTFIGRADKALYRAKNDGRNCIRLADESDDIGPSETGQS